MQPREQLSEGRWGTEVKALSSEPPSGQGRGASCEEEKALPEKSRGTVASQGPGRLGQKAEMDSCVEGC